MDKHVLRAEMRARRRAFLQELDDVERTASLGSLTNRLIGLLPPSGRVASYSAIGDEVDPARVSAALGRRLALPYFASADAPMTFRLATGPLQIGPFRIPQPTAEARQVEPDILLVPLVAADRHRNRLGQGKGHYDRALAALSAKKPIQTIGLAWDAQIVDRLPTDPWDVPLDLVVTPTRILR